MLSKRMMKSRGVLVAGLLAGSTMAGAAQADLLYDDFSSGYTYGADIEGQSGGTGWAPGSSWYSTQEANQFTPGGLSRLVTPDERVEFERDGSTGIVNQTVRREYEDPGLASYSLFFQVDVFNLDTSQTSWIQLQDGPGDNQAAQWLIFARGNEANWTNANGDPVWVYHDAGGWNLTDVVVADDTSFEIEIELLGNDQYRFHVDDGTNAYSSGVAGFRTAASDGIASRVLGLQTRMDNENNTTHWAVSEIQAVPEPGSVALLAAGLSLLALRRRR